MIKDYQEKKDLYQENKVFDTLSVDLFVSSTSFDGNPIYLLKDIEVDNERHENSELSKLQDLLQLKLNSLQINSPISDSHSSWSVFYTIKEIVDIIKEKLTDFQQKDLKPFYRGQTGDWPIEPTLFRTGETGYEDAFRENFEQIYKSISQKYPEKLEYIDKLDDDKRTNNLAELQHYGFGTPLIDISENPFIAMLFMVSDYQKGNEPQLNVFFKERYGKNKIFQETTKTDNNPRIAAQKGSFLNFDMIDWDSISNSEPVSLIPRIKINIKYREESIQEKDFSILPDGNDSSFDEKTKKEFALLTAIQDIEEKLNSFEYRVENLFPDFFMSLTYIKKRYRGNKAPKNSKWYEVEPKVKSL